MKENKSVKDIYSVKSIDAAQCKEWFLKKHYAHRLPNTIYSLGLYNGNVLNGVISFGMTANNNLNEIIEGFRCLELNRLVVNDGLDKNVLSYFVSQSLKLLPKPLVIISYADSSHGHHGYIYQATNWIYTGMGKGDYEFKKDGKQYHRKNIFDKFGTGNLQNAIDNGYEVVKVLPKHRYFYFCANKRDVAKMKRTFPYSIEPYPKGDNIRYDSSYNPMTLMPLF